MISVAQKLSTFLNEKVNSSTWTRDFLRQARARQCLLCAGTHHAASPICCGCSRDLPWLLNGCGRCGVQIPLDTDSRICAACIRRAPDYDRCEGLFHYDFPVRELITDFKFQGKTWYADLFGQLLAQRIQERYVHAQPDVILPTPLHPRRLRQRGFNQALEMARVAGKRTGIRLDYRSLKKIKATAAQSELAARERTRNLLQSFRVEGSLHGMHVLLIDDIVTTGHTANEISHVLKRSGVARVDVLCIARTPPPRRRAEAKLSGAQLPSSPTQDKP